MRILYCNSLNEFPSAKKIRSKLIGESDPSSLGRFVRFITIQVL